MTTNDIIMMDRNYNKCPKCMNVCHSQNETTELERCMSLERDITRGEDTLVW